MGREGGRSNATVKIKKEYCNLKGSKGLADIRKVRDWSVVPRERQGWKSRELSQGMG